MGPSASPRAAIPSCTGWSPPRPWPVLSSAASSWAGSRTEPGDAGSSWPASCGTPCSPRPLPPRSTPRASSPSGSWRASVSAACSSWTPRSCPSSCPPRTEGGSWSSSTSSGLWVSSWRSPSGGSSSSRASRSPGLRAGASCSSQRRSPHSSRRSHAGLFPRVRSTSRATGVWRSRPRSSPGSRGMRCNPRRYRRSRPCQGLRSSPCFRESWLGDPS